MKYKVSNKLALFLYFFTSFPFVFVDIILIGCTISELIEGDVNDALVFLISGLIFLFFTSIFFIGIMNYFNGYVEISGSTLTKCDAFKKIHRYDLKDAVFAKYVKTRRWNYIEIKFKDRKFTRIMLDSFTSYEDLIKRISGYVHVNRNRYY